MREFVIISGVWLCLVIVGVVTYFVYTRYVPKTIVDKLSGWKTKLLGVIIAISPDLISFLSFIQVLGQDWAPSDQMTWVLRGIGTAITVLRYVTDKEQT